VVYYDNTMKDVTLSKNQTRFILGFFVLIGVVLRLLFLDRLTFGYDQARDALQAISIIRDGNLKLIGPTTDIKGLFHGPLFWYLIAPWYYVSSGNPVISRIFMVFLNSLNIVFIYYFALKLFKKNTIALMSALFFAVSFEAIQYARWLSNPPPALLSIGIFLYGFWMVLNNAAIGFPLMLLCWIISVQFQFFLIYQGIFVLMALLILLSKKRKEFFLTFKNYWYLYLATIFFGSTFALSELKFKFQGLKAVLGFFTRSTTVDGEPLIFKLTKFYNSLVRNISLFLTFENRISAALLLLVLVLFSVFIYVKRPKVRKQTLFLLIWFFSPVLIYPLEKNNAYFLNIGIIYPLIIMISVLISETQKIRGNLGKVLFFAVTTWIISVNLFLIFKYNPKGETLFSVQDRQILSDEEKVMDYTYLSSGKKMFGFNSVTNPLFISSTWAYVFDWYGKRKYGYLPAWMGYPLDDVGKEIEFPPLGSYQGKYLYLIIEPTPGIPEEYIRAYIRYEDTRSRLVERKQIGAFIVEKRQLTSKQHFLRDDLMKHISIK